MAPIMGERAGLREQRKRRVTKAKDSSTRPSVPRRGEGVLGSTGLWQGTLI